MEYRIKFNLQKTKLSTEAEIYWTSGDGYKLFLDKTLDLLLQLDKGDYFEFQAYCSGPDRDIVKDFDNDKFKVIGKSGFVSGKGQAVLIFEVEPIRYLSI